MIDLSLNDPQPTRLLRINPIRGILHPLDDLLAPGMRRDRPETAIDAALLLLGLAASLPRFQVAVDALAGLLTAYALSGRHRHRHSSVMLLFLALAAGSFLITEIPLPKATLVFLPTALMLLGIFDLRVRPALLLSSIVSGALMQATLTILAALLWGNGARVTLVGQFQSPLIIAGAIACATLLIRDRTPDTAGRTKMVFLLGYIMIAVVLVQTRGLVIAFVLSMAASMLVASGGPGRIVRKSLGVVARLSVLVLVLYVAKPDLFHRFLGESSALGLQGRNTEQRAAWQLVRDGPFFGRGVGFAFDNPIAAGDEMIIYVHNSVLYFGLIGGVPLMVAFLMIPLAILRGLRDTTEPVRMAILTLALGIFFSSLSAAIQREGQFVILLSIGLIVAGMTDERAAVGRAGRKARRVEGELVEAGESDGGRFLGRGAT